MQTNVQIKGDKITGTLKYVTGFDQFDKSENEGNYLSLDLSAGAGVTIKTKVEGGKHGEVTVNDGFCVYHITDNKKQKITVSYEKDGQKLTETYDLTGLTLTPKSGGV